MFKSVLWRSDRKEQKILKPHPVKAEVKNTFYEKNDKMWQFPFLSQRSYDVFGFLAEEICSVCIPGSGDDTFAGFFFEK